MARGGKGKERTLTEVLGRFLEKRLVPDLRERVEASAAVKTALEQALAKERAAGRTADDPLAFRERLLEQVGAAWLLSAVFVRYLEDRALLEHRRLAGPGAEDAQERFGAAFPGLAGNAREYLLAVFREGARLPGAREVLGAKNNPVYRLGPSTAVAGELLGLFRERAADGALVWRFDGDDTRVLGDLYQDLSPGVRERYALLQTPGFVEEFILERTLDPAVKEFGLGGVRVLDPTCGSGHFLLGAFERLRGLHQKAAPAGDAKQWAREALAQVYGVDLNPYAVAISRFRLLVAYVRAAGITTLREAPEDLALDQHVVVADSLLPFGRQLSLMDASTDNALRESFGGQAFVFEDPAAIRELFSRRYHAVIGNPPYITCKDAAQRDTIREMYPKSAYRTFALGVPFTERFFQLAVDGGYVGLINANSFMKREFGRPLIEQVLKHLDVTHVIDTAGAFIPGHGTPTVILFARNQKPKGSVVRAALGKRGEPETPEDAAKGKVWSGIIAGIDRVGYEDEFVSVTDTLRTTFTQHPWSLGGGGASDLKAHIEQRCAKRMDDVVELIGFGAVTREDDAYQLGAGACTRLGISTDQVRQLVSGEDVRDWALQSPEAAIWPYDPTSLGTVSGASAQRVGRAMWPWKAQLSSRVAYGQNQIQRRLKWFEYSMFFRERFRTPLSITFAFVATHNHFVLDRGGKVFKQSAPIIKLPEGATEEDHLALLGWLNSSTACFWMKQVCMNKGATSDKGVLQDDPERFRFEFDGTKLLRMPIVADFATWREGRLSKIAQLLGAAAEELSRPAFEQLLGEVEPSQIASSLAQLLMQREKLRGQMVRWQEELDWSVYELVGLLPVEHPARSSQMMSDLSKADPMDPDTRPYRLPAECEDPRVAAAKTIPFLGLLERPEYKRRWFRSAGAYDSNNITDKLLLERAARTVLLRLVEEAVQRSSEAQSVRTLLGALLMNARTVYVAKLVSGEPHFDESQLRDLLECDAIPFETAMRFTVMGMEKRALWERTWELQRREDAGETLATPIPVPPKYDQTDYSETRYWTLRGRLDVPRERFISYPQCATDDDPSPLYGWAGWDHKQRADALAALYQRRKTEDGWPAERLAPLLAGLLELVPWLLQWHNAPEAGEDQGAGDAYRAYVESEAREQGLTLDALRAWRPLDKREARELERAKAAKVAAEKKPVKPAKRAKAPAEEPAEEPASRPLDDATGGAAPAAAPRRVLRGRPRKTPAT